jgi:hypothetical protein
MHAPHAPVVAALLLVAGCGADDSHAPEDASADSVTDTAVDTHLDAATDTTSEPAMDTSPEVPPGGDMGPDTTIVLLHHSTGGRIWAGGVPEWFGTYNAENSTSYAIDEVAFPSSDGYGWQNYPYDYWNIWVQNAGPDPYMTEPTLEMLAADYDVIVFKHCYPVSGIVEDSGSHDVSSSTKSIENYRLQYAALKDKLHEFPDNRFIVWTGAALVQGATDEGQATRARQFFTWVEQEWDEPGDNVFVWDFFELETEGGIYMLDEHADSTTDSHPNDTFSAFAAPLFGARVVSVIQGTGDATSLTGE